MPKHWKETWQEYRARKNKERREAVQAAEEYAQRSGNPYAAPWQSKLKAVQRTQQRARKAAREAAASKRAPRPPVAASAGPPAAAENASSSTAAPSKQSCEAASAPETPTRDMTYTPPDEPTTPADEPMFIKPLVKEPPGKEERVGEEEPVGEDLPPEEDAATAEASAEASADPAGVLADPVGVPAAPILPAEDLAASIASVASYTSTTAVFRGTPGWRAGDLTIPRPPRFPPPGVPFPSPGVTRPPSFLDSWIGAPAAQSRARTNPPRPPRKKQRTHSQSSASRREDPDYPMPDRLPPFVLDADHEVNPKLDVDWTLCPEDEEKEKRFREVRNEMLKEKLLEGKSVCFRSSGGSLRPRVYSNDRCTYVPVKHHSEVQLDHIVFCQPQPRGYFYAHIVARTWWYDDDPNDEPQYCFKIANAKGRPNGWCYMKHIYGKLTLVVPDRSW